MSWHYLLGQEAASWEADCSAGAPGALSKLIPTAAGCSWPDNETVFSNRSRSGMTSAPSTEGDGADTSTSSAAASPVRTSPAPAKGQGSKASDRASGWRWPGSFVRYDPDSHSWKTRQCLLLGGSESFSETWPKWGSMRDGECSVQSTQAPLIDEKESGLLHTPTANEYGSCQGGSSGREGQTNRPSLQTMARRALWPTPRAANPWSRPSGGGGKILQEEVLIAEGLRERGKKLFPTPTTPQSRDYKGAPGKGCQERGGHQSSLPAEVGGKLNPPWVEWLMGWPIGWTDCEPLATDRFQQWLDSHGRP